MNTRKPGRQLVIDRKTLVSAVEELSAGSEIVREIVERYGMPPLWRREPGFDSLVYTILEQQVSLVSAKSTYEKLRGVVGPITPGGLARLSDAELRDIGLSRQKIEYCRTLAELVESGDLDLNILADRGDEDVRATLMNVRGIGKWTADIYLLHSLGRPDVWPTGDLALQVSVSEYLGLSDRPAHEELEELGVPFRPWRSVAARVFWQYYLQSRGIAEVS